MSSVCAVTRCVLGRTTYMLYLFFLFACFVLKQFEHLVGFWRFLAVWVHASGAMSKCNRNCSGILWRTISVEYVAMGILQSHRSTDFP